LPVSSILLLAPAAASASKYVQWATNASDKKYRTRVKWELEKQFKKNLLGDLTLSKCISFGLYENEGMSNPIYIRCQNSKCNKLNPIQPDEAELVKEHTCIFCGYIIAPEKTSKADEDTSSKSKGRNKRFPLQQSESKPINRNTRKPTF
jgi:hypothetical protein